MILIVGNPPHSLDHPPLGLTPERLMKTDIVFWKGYEGILPPTLSHQSLSIVFIIWSIFFKFNIKKYIYSITVIITVESDLST